MSVTDPLGIGKVLSAVVKQYTGIWKQKRKFENYRYERNEVLTQQNRSAAFKLSQTKLANLDSISINLKDSLDQLDLVLLRNNGFNFNQCHALIKPVTDVYHQINKDMPNSSASRDASLILYGNPAANSMSLQSLIMFLADLSAKSNCRNCLRRVQNEMFKSLTDTGASITNLRASIIQEASDLIYETKAEISQLSQ